ncbi:ArnT family glycosyltransferase [Asticcacaulis benevestitus]|uniref:ArnT family glycosyltransferase n=1 Tax=Asticcacaulis benevestitus TaxID=347481 RepID=UPI0003A3807B|nr:glycosyltransferase family 39 protein [Asticcacaulis benevestitus]
MRLPFAHVIDNDEAFYSVVASRWLKGELPYSASFDIKPPGLFAIFAVAQMLFGSSLATIKGLEILFTAWGAYSLHKLMKRHGSPEASVLIGLLYPVFSLFFVGVSSPCQLIQAAFTIAAFVWLLDSGVAAARRQALLSAGWAGLMIGCACLVKQTAVFEALGLLGWLVWQAWLKKDVRPSLIFCAAAALPVMAFGLYFAVAGHLGDAIEAITMTAVQRSQLNMSADAGACPELILRFWHVMAIIKPVIVLIAGSVLALLRLRRLQLVFTGPLITLTLIWYAAVVVGLLVLRSPEIWYGYDLIPPALILFCGILCHGMAFSPHQRRPWIVAYSVIACLQPLLMDHKILFSDGPDGRPDYIGNVRAAQSLKAAGLRHNDSLLVLSRGHYVHVFTHAMPNARYFNAMHLWCVFPTPDKDPLAEALSVRPRFIVFSGTDYMIGCAQLDRLKIVEPVLAADYDRVAEVSGRWDHFSIYRRKIDPVAASVTSE